MLDTYIKWIAAHERMLLLAIGGLVIWFAIGRVDTLIANHDKANLTQAQTTALIQANKDQALAAASQQAAVQYQALAEKVAAQNTALIQSNVTLAAALAKQQKTDATLPPTELVARWNTLVPQAAASVSNGQVTLPNNGAVATVQELEKVPVLSTQLENKSSELENDEQLLVAGKALNTTLYAQIDGLNLQITDNKKVCSDQIAVVKANARKSKLKWFGAGFVTGLTLGIWKF